MLPLSYLLRNLARRRLRTTVTAAGIAATTLLVVAMHSFAAGMATAAVGSARDDVVLLLGAAAEVDLVRSVIPRGSAEIAAGSAPGVATIDGIRAASIELHVASRRGNQIGLLRGVTDAAYVVHPRLCVVEGREPRAPFEVMVGSLAPARMGLSPGETAIGRTIELERRPFTVVGRFVAPGTVLEAEIWGRLSDVMLATKREDVSCVVLRLESAASVGDVQVFARRRVDLEIAAVPEPEAMAAVAQSLTPIAALARWMAALAVVAGAFACANTMFAAVLARTREIATLRSLGYGSFAIAVGLLQESAMIAFLGGAIGTLVALLVGDVSLRYPMGALALHADLESRSIGLGAALVSGFLGGIVPAIRAVRIPLVEALGGRS